MAIPMALIYKGLWASISTFETPPRDGAGCLTQLPHPVAWNPLCIWVFSFVSSLGDVLVSGFGLHDFYRAIKPCIFIWKIGNFHEPPKVVNSLSGSIAGMA